MSDQPSYEFASLAEIGRAITSSPPEPSELAEIAYLETARLIETDFFQLGLFEDDKYRTLIWVRDGERLDNLTFQIEEGNEGLLGWMRKTRQPLLVRNFEEELPYLPAKPSYTATDPPLSGIFSPLRHGEQVMGIIAVQNRRADAFTSEQLSILEVIASSLSPSLANTQLRERQDSLLSQIELAEEVSHQIASLDLLDSRLDRIVLLICQAFGYQEVALYEHRDGVLQLKKSSLDSVQEMVPSPSPPRIVQSSLENHRVEITKRVNHAEFPEGEGLESEEAAFPMMVESRVMGVLYINSRSGQTISVEQQSLFRTMAAQIAFAIQEARNYDQQQEETWITTVLLEVARHAAQPGDPEEALEAVLQLAILLGGVEWAMLLVSHETGGNLLVGPAAGLKRQDLLYLSNLQISPESLGVKDDLVEVDQPVQIDLPDELARVLGSQEALSIVLSDGETLLGVLLFQHQALPGRRSLILGGIAHQISLRIENTRLIEEAAYRQSLERELKTARNIQASFLPDTVPQHAGWEVGVTWQAAREMGGDFYDFISLPEGANGPLWGIVIADVADKGVPAALYMALSRTLLRTIAMSRLMPDEALEEVNRLLIKDARTDMFVSIFYAIWEPSSGKLTYANAGHNPPLIVTPGVKSTRLTAHGMVLGVESDAEYESQDVQIHEGDFLVLYTDGVTEAFDSHGDMFGIHRLEHLILGSHYLPAQSVAERISERVLRFSVGQDIVDDLTAVVLHRSKIPHENMAEE